jgi:hypothetical protein
MGTKRAATSSWKVEGGSSAKSHPIHPKMMWDDVG